MSSAISIFVIDFCFIAILYGCLPVWRRVGITTFEIRIFKHLISTKNNRKTLFSQQNEIDEKRKSHEVRSHISSAKKRKNILKICKAKRRRRSKKKKNNKITEYQKLNTSSHSFHTANSTTNWLHFWHICHLEYIVNSMQYMLKSPCI